MENNDESARNIYTVHNVALFIAPDKGIQSTLVISTSLISNNCLSRSENLVPAYT